MLVGKDTDVTYNSKPHVWNMNRTLHDWGLLQVCILSMSAVLMLAMLASLTPSATASWLLFGTHLGLENKSHVGCHQWIWCFFEGISYSKYLSIQLPTSFYIESATAITAFHYSPKPSPQRELGENLERIAASLPIFFGAWISVSKSCWL